MSTARRAAAAVLTCVAILGACSSDDDSGDAARSTTTVRRGSFADSGNSDGWAVYGHDYSNTRLNPDETAVTAATVAQLEKSWSKDGIVGVTGTPTVDGGVAYFSDWNGKVWAVDAETGAEQWTATVPGGFVVGAVAVADDGVFVANGHSLYRFDRATGKQDWQAETDDHPQAQINASPVVVDGLVLQGTASFENTLSKETYTFRGSIGAWDAATGAPKWKFYTTPNDKTAGPGVGIWGTPAVDVERGLLYVGTGQALMEPTGRLADSILAIDYKSGKLQWSTQFTYPDVFSNGFPLGKDADVGASPTMWTSNGRDLVGAGDKGGTFHAVDRDTGKVVWDTELTPGSAFGGEIGSSAFVDGALIATSNVGQPGAIFPKEESKVFALDPASGKIKWSVEQKGKVFAPVSAVPGVAFVATDMGQMRALDSGTGEELWHFKAPDKTACGPSIVDGRVLWGYGFILFGPPGNGGVISFTLPS